MDFELRPTLTAARPDDTRTGSARPTSARPVDIRTGSARPTAARPAAVRPNAASPSLFSARPPPARPPLSAARPSFSDLRPTFSSDLQPSDSTPTQSDSSDARPSFSAARPSLPLPSRPPPLPSTTEPLNFATPWPNPDYASHDDTGFYPSLSFPVPPNIFSPARPPRVRPPVKKGRFPIGPIARPPIQTPVSSVIGVASPPGAAIEGPVKGPHLKQMASSSPAADAEQVPIIHGNWKLEPIPAPVLPGRPVLRPTRPPRPFLRLPNQPSNVMRPPLRPALGSNTHFLHKMGEPSEDHLTEEAPTVEQSPESQTTTDTPKPQPLPTTQASVEEKNMAANETVDDDLYYYDYDRDYYSEDYSDVWEPDGVRPIPTVSADILPTEKSDRPITEEQASQRPITTERATTTEPIRNSQGTKSGSPPAKKFEALFQKILTQIQEHLGLDGEKDSSNLPLETREQSDSLLFGSNHFSDHETKSPTTSPKKDAQLQEISSSSSTVAPSGGGSQGTDQLFPLFPSQGEGQSGLPDGSTTMTP
ncbi:unnamed protein product, partial [Cyprideis torosa]